MILPALLAIASIAAGAALGLLRGDSRRALRAVQLAALAAALGVALLQLLPEALEQLGAAALAAFALPLLPLLRPVTHSARALAVELGYAALLVHQLGDGVLLGAYGGMLFAARDHAGLLAAIALHTVPVAAAIALRFESATAAGPRSRAAPAWPRRACSASVSRAGSRRSSPTASIPGPAR